MNMLLKVLLLVSVGNVYGKNVKVLLKQTKISRFWKNNQTTILAATTAVGLLVSAGLLYDKLRVSAEGEEPTLPTLKVYESAEVKEPTLTDAQLRVSAKVKEPTLPKLTVYKIAKVKEPTLTDAHVFYKHKMRYMHKDFFELWNEMKNIDQPKYIDSSGSSGRDPETTRLSQNQILHTLSNTCAFKHVPKPDNTPKPEKHIKNNITTEYVENDGKLIYSENTYEMHIYITSPNNNIHIPFTNKRYEVIRLNHYRLSGNADASKRNRLEILFRPAFMDDIYDQEFIKKCILLMIAQANEDNELLKCNDTMHIVFIKYTTHSDHEKKIIDNMKYWLEHRGIARDMTISEKTISNRNL